MKKIFVVLVIFLILTACKQPGESASVLIDNQSGENVDAVFITPSTSPTWGSNLLGGNIIPIGQSHVFSGFTPDTYDIRVELDVALVAHKWDIELSSGETYTWVLPHAP